MQLRQARGWIAESFPWGAYGDVGVEKTRVRLLTRRSPGPGGRTRSARLAVLAIFAFQGIGSASWYVRIPAVQQELGLSPGQLGFSLLGAAIGSLIAMPITGSLVARVGSGRMTTVGALVFCLSLPIPTLARGPWSLLAALILFGVGAGIVDVSMNVQAAAVELRAGRAMMSSFHGLFSLGGLIGAAIGGVIASQGVVSRLHLSVVALALLAGSLVISRWFLPKQVDDDVHAHGPAFARPTVALAGLGIVAFCALLSEGAMADWSAVYLRQSLGSGPGLAAAGYAVFSVTMALGRLGGDRLIEILSPVRAVRIGGLVVALGLGLSLLLSQSAAALAGFASVGAGLSFVFPAALSAAGRMRSMSPGAAIAAVSTAGYFGFLVGPPSIGLLAGGFSLRLALGVVVLLGLGIAATAGSVGQPPTPAKVRHAPAPPGPR